jgi:hypothetical protein
MPVWIHIFPGSFKTLRNEVSFGSFSPALSLFFSNSRVNGLQSILVNLVFLPANSLKSVEGNIYFDTLILLGFV